MHIFLHIIADRRLIKHTYIQTHRERELHEPLIGNLYINAMFVKNVTLPNFKLWKTKWVDGGMGGQIEPNLHLLPIPHTAVSSTGDPELPFQTHTAEVHASCKLS